MSLCSLTLCNAYFIFRAIDLTEYNGPIQFIFVFVRCNLRVVLKLDKNIILPHVNFVSCIMYLRFVSFSISGFMFSVDFVVEISKNNIHPIILQPRTSRYNKRCVFERTISLIRCLFKMSIISKAGAF
jgi:hypothetical protein